MKTWHWMIGGCCLLAFSSSLKAAEKEKLILFSLVSDQGNSEQAPMINAELFMVADGAGRFEIIRQEELGESSLMDPVESLNFCNHEPGCIAEVGKEKAAKWIVYGSVQQTPDQLKTQVHLVLIDVPGKKRKEEKTSQYSEGTNVVMETGNLLRELLGLPLPKPKTPPPSIAQVKQPPPGETKTASPLIPGQAPVAAASAPPSRSSRWSNPWFWTTLGVGVAAMAAGGTMGYLCYAKTNDAKSAADQPTAYAMMKDARTFSLGANISFGAGGAALLSSLLILILDTGESTPPPVRAGVACSGRECGTVFTFSF